MVVTATDDTSGTDFLTDILSSPAVDIDTMETHEETLARQQHLQQQAHQQTQRMTELTRTGLMKTIKKHNKSMDQHVAPSSTGSGRGHDKRGILPKRTHRLLRPSCWPSCWRPHTRPDGTRTYKYEFPHMTYPYITNEYGTMFDVDPKLINGKYPYSYVYGSRDAQSRYGYRSVINIIYINCNILC